MAIIIFGHSSSVSYPHCHNLLSSTTVDCVWHEWSPWTECSALCGGGTRTRTRGKTDAMYGGKDCVGESSETQVCNTEDCPGIAKRNK